MSHERQKQKKIKYEKVMTIVNSLRGTPVGNQKMLLKFVIIP